jgi:hypothetical protein
MDPNVTLAQLREKRHGNFIESETRELFDALDGWLKSGGFLPDDWQRYPTVCDNSLAEVLK